MLIPKFFERSLVVLFGLDLYFLMISLSSKSFILSGLFKIIVNELIESINV